MVEVEITSGSVISINDAYINLLTECQVYDERAYYSQRKYLGDLIRRTLPAARFEEAKSKQESIRIIHDSKGKDVLQGNKKCF